MPKCKVLFNKPLNTFNGCPLQNSNLKADKNKKPEYKLCYSFIPYLLNFSQTATTAVKTKSNINQSIFA